MHAAHTPSKRHSPSPRPSHPGLSAVAGACLALLVQAPAALAAASWTAPVKLATSSQTQGILNPAVATNATGQTLAAWVQDGQVVARQSQNGVWGNPVTLSQAGQGVASPTVAMAADGRAVAAWVQAQGGGQSSIEAAFYSNGQWSLPVTVSNTGLVATSPQMRLDASGQATLVWSEGGTGSPCGIMTATGTPAAGWSDPLTLADSCNQHIRLSVNSAGEAATSWSDVNGLNGAGVTVATRDANGTWSAPVQIVPPQYRQYLPGIALGEDGTAVVVWNNAYTGLMWSRKRRNGNWSAAAPVYAGYYNFATGADVVVDGQGNATAIFLVWVMTPTGATAYPLQSAQLKAYSSTWSRPLYVTGKNQNIYLFSADASPAGSLVVGWSDSMTGGRSGVSSMLPGETKWSSASLGKGGYEVAVDAATGSAAMLWNNTYAPVSLSVSTAITP